MRRSVMASVCLLLVILTLATQPAPAVQAHTQINLLIPVGGEWFGVYVAALPNGHIVIADYKWDSPTVANVGAVYLYDETGALLATLTGSQNGDMVGSNGIIILASGNYVVASPLWKNGTAGLAGAVTWCSGATGCSGQVTAANSLVGSTAVDTVGNVVVPLSGGEYVVASFQWDNGAIADAGFARRCPATGCTGSTISQANSLVGTATNDWIGREVYALSNGGYVACSSAWNAGRGAATGCPAAGCTGQVSAANSLVGTAAQDYVCSAVAVLDGGRYVVASPNWDNGATNAAGAATGCTDATTCKGAVSAANSLVGSHANDKIGSRVVGLGAAYAVSGVDWDGGRGAWAWCPAAIPCKGEVSDGNSLVGSAAGEKVGGGEAAALPSGGYVVGSPDRNSQRGAATWCPFPPCTGAVTESNSLLGSAAGDRVGERLAALANGNYLVSAKGWNGGRGAVVLCDGAAGCTGALSASEAGLPAGTLVGATAADAVGRDGMVALPDGGYLVISSRWSAGRGAVTRCFAGGCSGPVTDTNSLTGSAPDDWVGDGGATVLPTGDYVVHSTAWDGGTEPGYRGAITVCSARNGCRRPISSANSVQGGPLGGGYYLDWAYDATQNRLVVGRPYDNTVTLFGITWSWAHLPIVVRAP